MTDNQKAIEVLKRAREQLIREIATCGLAGGVGRAQNYAPVLVNIAEALAVAEELESTSATLIEPTPAQIRMAAVRAAKTNPSKDE